MDRDARRTATARWRTAADFRQIEGSGRLRLEEHRRYPLCRLLLHCTACGWARDYAPERIVERLQALRLAGHGAMVSDVARQVSWNCPDCARMRWASQLAYRPDTTAREVERAARALRS